MEPMDSAVQSECSKNSSKGRKPGLTKSHPRRQRRFFVLLRPRRTKRLTRIRDSLNGISCRLSEAGLYFFFRVALANPRYSDLQRAASLRNRPAKKFSFGGMNQWMRGKYRSKLRQRAP